MQHITKDKGFIEELLKDDFFQSLRDDYKEFNDWYIKSVNDDSRTSFYWLEDKKVIAFIGLKIEDESIMLDGKKLPKKKRIKITTIKSTVDLSRFSGMVFYKAFKKAAEENTKEVYFSIIPDTEDKVKLLEIAKSFGFRIIGSTKKSAAGIERKNNEVYLLKTIGEKSPDWKISYPKLPSKDNRKCKIMMMESKYHDDYLQDTKIKNTLQKTDFSKMAIKKVYIHGQWNLAQMQPGDLAFIYRKSSEGKAAYHSVITSYCVIIDQKTKGIDYKTFEEFKKITKNIHAFEPKELKEWYDNNKHMTIFGFIRAFGEGNNVNYKWLKDNNIFFGSGNPYDNELSQEEIRKLLKKAKVMK